VSAGHADAVAPAGTSGATRVVADLVRYLETGDCRDDLFAPDCFADLSLPHWRVQTGTATDIRAERTAGHPASGEIVVGRVEPTPHGFTIEFEERWWHEGQRWYAREMVRADVVADSIVELSIYCTGDWDESVQREHAEKVRLLRP
jgi:hypothetical protein